MKSYMAKAETMERKWYVVDAEGMVLGRLASQVAAILRGKHKPILPRMLTAAITLSSSTQIKSS